MSFPEHTANRGSPGLAVFERRLSFHFGNLSLERHSVLFLGWAIISQVTHLLYKVPHPVLPSTFPQQNFSLIYFFSPWPLVLIVIRSKCKLSRGSQHCKDLSEDQKQIASSKNMRATAWKAADFPNGRHVCRSAGWRLSQLGLAVSYSTLCFPWGVGGGGGGPRVDQGRREGRTEGVQLPFAS